MFNFNMQEKIMIIKVVCYTYNNKKVRYWNRIGDLNKK